MLFTEKFDNRKGVKLPKPKMILLNTGQQIEEKEIVEYAGMRQRKRILFKDEKGRKFMIICNGPYWLMKHGDPDNCPDWLIKKKEKKPWVKRGPKKSPKKPKK